MVSADLRDDLFGTTLVPYPFHQPLPSAADTTQRKDTAQTMSNEIMAYILVEFADASKGNPGQAGAGVILRSPDGSAIARVHEGLVSVTNNVAEYRALILGPEHALKKGYTKFQVQARILALNASYFLKNEGHFVISIKANCIDSTVPAEAVFPQEVKKLQQEQFKPEEQG